MPTEFVMTATAWGTARFASSYLWETMLAIRTLTVRHHQAVHRHWLERVDRAAVGAAAPGLVALIPRRGWSPDFLTPASAPGAVTFAEQLQAVRDTPAATVADEVAQSLASSPSRARSLVLRPVLEDPERGRDDLVRQLDAAYDLLVAPWAGRLARLLDAEVHRRAETAVRAGIVAAVGEIHPDVTARPGRVSLEGSHEGTVRCRELVLVPSVFAWPYPVPIVDAAVPALAYPVPGVATVWEEAPPAPGALTALLGRGRADLLAALAEPASTTTLAQSLHVAPSTVSEHLAVLRDAGLVVRERRGRSVLYRRTAHGSLMFS